MRKSAAMRAFTALFCIAILYGCDPGVTPDAGTTVPGVLPGDGEPVTLPTLAAGSVSSYMVHYGNLTPEAIAIAKRHDLVILHPAGADLTREQVAEIQRGEPPHDGSTRVIVMAYIAVGEDPRTSRFCSRDAGGNAVIDYQGMRADTWNGMFTGDGTGPRVDPRGSLPDGGPLPADIDGRGLASPGGTGFASWYLDDDSRNNGGAADGLPDFNTAWGCAFVNPGDPAWFRALDAMCLDGPSGHAGFAEILTRTAGRGLGCDGVFLDALDTCAPNSFTGAGDAVRTEFEWTAPGMNGIIARIRTAYPGRLILQNRALFFFDPRFPHYGVTTRGLVDFVLFESYRLNSARSAAARAMGARTRRFDPDSFYNNKYHTAPFLLAEAGRSDGFRVLSLGYAEDAAYGDALYDTLRAGCGPGADLLETDLREAREMGFVHYITDKALVVANAFCLDRPADGSAAGPHWISTWNPGAWNSPTPPAARSGIGTAEPGPFPGTVIVRWDVAAGSPPVTYALSFGREDSVRMSSRVLVPLPDDAYGANPASAAFPNRAMVEGLEAGISYRFRIRARDGAGNEDGNDVIVSCTAP
jgi:hypothetical protein